MFSLFCSQLFSIQKQLPHGHFNATGTSDTISLVKRKKKKGATGRCYILRAPDTEHKKGFILFSVTTPDARRLRPICGIGQRVEKRETMVNRDFKWGCRKIEKNRRTLSISRAFLKCEELP